MAAEGACRVCVERCCSSCASCSTHIFHGAITVCQVLTHIVVCDSAGLQHHIAASSRFRQTKLVDITKQQQSLLPKTLR